MQACGRVELDGGGQSASYSDSFTLGKMPQICTEWECDWAPEPIWTFWTRKKFLVQPRN